MWTTRSILLLGKTVTRGIVSLPQQFKMATQNFAQESKEPGAGILQMTPCLDKQKEAVFGYQCLLQDATRLDGIAPTVSTLGRVGGWKAVEKGWMLALSVLGGLCNDSQYVRTR